MTKRPRSLIRTVHVLFEQFLVRHCKFFCRFVKVTAYQRTYVVGSFTFLMSLRVYLNA